MNKRELHGAEGVRHPEPVEGSVQLPFSSSFPSCTWEHYRCPQDLPLAQFHFGYIFYCISPPQHDILGNTTMSTVQEIKQAVRKLPLNKRLKVVKWVTAFDNDEWDKQISKDAASGKLDFLVREGKEALKKGRLQPISPRSQMRPSCNFL